MEKSLNKDEKLTTARALLAAVCGYFSLIISQLAAVLIGQVIGLTGLPSAIGSAVSGILYLVFAFFCVSFICRKILKISLGSCRITKLSVKRIWSVTALILPVMVAGTYFLMKGNWVKTPMNTGMICYTVVDAIVFYGIAAGIVEEIIFRGIVMTALERRWNKYAAVIIPSVIFALSHVIGAELDLLSILQLLAAGTIVGVMFSLITYESGSVWNSAIVHIIWNIFFVGGIMHIGIEPNKYSLFNYVLASKSFIVTGGDFGVEASGIAILGYVVFSILALILIKKKGQRTS